MNKHFIAEAMDGTWITGDSVIFEGLECWLVKDGRKTLVYPDSIKRVTKGEEDNENLS